MIADIKLNNFYDLRFVRFHYHLFGHQLNTQTKLKFMCDMCTQIHNEIETPRARYHWYATNSFIEHTLTHFCSDVDVAVVGRPFLRRTSQGEKRTSAINDNRLRDSVFVSGCTYFGRYVDWLIDAWLIRMRAKRSRNAFLMRFPTTHTNTHTIFETDPAQETTSNFLFLLSSELKWSEVKREKQQNETNFISTKWQQQKAKHNKST